MAYSATGVVTPLVDGVRAALDSEYLEDLKRHTRRGMSGGSAAKTVGRPWGSA